MASVKTKSNWKLSEFVAHGSNVNCLALSPSNGHMLATGGDDRRVNLWLVGKPNNIMSISGMTSPVQSVAFNNSENWIGAGPKSGVIKVFDLDQNKAVRSISGHKAAICSLDFHRYGDILASGSMDTNLKLWDVRRKGCIFTYKGHTEVINNIQFSPDGKWVVSGSSDASVKIWDLSAGKMIADFKMHTGAVTSIQFHPMEFLMCSGSSDRTVKFYDLERFQLVSESSPESNAIRKVLFHPDGTALFTGTQESLKVHGWEPSKIFDMLPLRWGKVEDMTLSGEQLIAASYAKTNVSVWCIAINQLRPFSGDNATVPNDPTPSDQPPLITSGRKLFEYEQQEISPPSSAESAGNTSDESGRGERVSSVSSEDGNDEEGSPPSQIKDKDRVQLFASRQKLIRTPPKKLQPPFSPPVGEDSPPSQLHHPPFQPSKLDQVQLVPNFHFVPQHVEQEHKENIPSSRPPEKYENGVPPERKIHLPHHQVFRQSQPNEPTAEKAIKDPTREMYRDFRPPQTNNDHPKVAASGHGSDSQALRNILTNHEDVSQILKSRLTSLKTVRGEWSASNPKVSLVMAVNLNNTSVLVDVLNTLHLKRTLWTLDMALIVLPELKALICNKYRAYVSCGCKATKLILKNFGPVIKNNLSAPPTVGGRDLQREERYEKCQSCHAHLLSLREVVVGIVRESSISPAAKVIRELALMPAFTVLD